MAVVEAIQIVLLVRLAALVVVAQETAAQVVLELLGKAILAAQVRELMEVVAAGLVPLVLRVVFLEAKAVLVRHHPLLARLLHTAAVAVVAAERQQVVLAGAVQVVLAQRLGLRELPT